MRALRETQSHLLGALRRHDALRECCAIPWRAARCLGPGVLQLEGDEIGVDRKMERSNSWGEGWRGRIRGARASSF